MICQSHEEIKMEIGELKKHMTVTVTNGKRIEKPINEAVAEIWEHTVLLRDINKTHWTFKRYGVYKVIGIILLLVILLHLGLNLKEIILKLLT